jgi:hypothetical protein
MNSSGYSTAGRYSLTPSIEEKYLLAVLKIMHVLLDNSKCDYAVSFIREGLLSTIQSIASLIQEPSLPSIAFVEGEIQNKSLTKGRKEEIKKLVTEIRQKLESK